MRIELTNERNETLTVDYSLTNVHVYDSYAISKNDIPEWVKIIKRTGEENKYTYSRSEKSWAREWIAHNVLFAMDIQPERTKEVDLNEDESLFKRFCYLLLSLLHI